MDRRISLFLVISFSLILLYSLSASAASTCTGSNYTGSGNWIIVNDTYCQDMIITLAQDGSVYINNKTVWQNVTIQLNPSGYLNKTGNIRNISARANITLTNASGSLYMNATNGDGCLIKSISNYNIEVFLWGAAIIENTEFNNLGWDRSGSGFDIETNGIWINTQKTVKLIDCTITSSASSLKVTANNTVIQGCNFTGLKGGGFSCQPPRFAVWNLTYVDNDYYDNTCGFGQAFYFISLSNISSNRFINNTGGFIEMLMNSTFSYNRVTRTGTGGYEVVIFNLGFEDYVSEGNFFDYNNISCLDDATSGIISAQYDPIDNDINNGNYYPINNSVFRYNRFDNCRFGMYIAGDFDPARAAYNNIFEGNRFTNDTYGMYLRWVDQALISDSIFTNVGIPITLNATGTIHIVDVNSTGLTGSDAILIQGDDSSGLISNTYVLNASVENVTLSYGNLYRMWYLNVFVNDSTNNPVENVFVIDYAKNGTVYQSSAYTAVNGYSGGLNATSYFQNSTITVGYNSQNVSISKVGYDSVSNQQVSVLGNAIFPITITGSGVVPEFGSVLMVAIALGIVLSGIVAIRKKK